MQKFHKKDLSNDVEGAGEQSLEKPSKRRHD